MIRAFANLPSTNLRIVITLLCVIATAFRYIVSATFWGPVSFQIWEPNTDWLVFLAAMSGIDAAQFAAKRLTHKEPA